MCSVVAVLSFAFASLLAAPHPVLPQARGPRIFISVDMEGIAGAVTQEQLLPTGFEYSRFREFMTEEALAAIRAAREGGAAEIVVRDSHGNGQNLLIERFPEDVTVVRSYPAPLSWMHGIDSTFDGVILIGYHASTTNREGVRAHTISSARLVDVQLNGRSLSEGGIAAAVAGHFGVPVIMTSGDDAAVAEVQATLGTIEGAVVKWHYGFHSARTLTPAASCKLIAEKTAMAVRRLRTHDFKPFVLSTPVTVDLRFKHYRPAEVLAYLPSVQRPDAHSVRYVAKNVLEAMQF